MLCRDCLQRENCTSLCPEAESYVNQDNVYQRELTLPDILYNNFSHFESIPNVHLTKREKQIVTLLGQELSRNDICQLLKISRGNLRLIFRRLKKKCNAFLQG